MSREEVKSAINQLLETSPDRVLQEVFDYLQHVEISQEDHLVMVHNLRTILKEDKELLERLAK